MIESRPVIIADRSGMEDMRFLVLGCGSIGKRHLRNLKKLGVKNILAHDVREDRRQEMEEEHSISVLADLEEAFERGIQVVLVCSPTHLHLQHALMAARAGCHLFIEKPIAHSLDGLDELLQEVERARLVTFVGCNFRFHPGLLHVKSLLKKGAIGTVISVRAQFGQYLPDWHPWEDYRQGYSSQRAMGGGVVLDRIHELDYLTWLLGNIQSIYAVVGHRSKLEIDTEDIAELLVEFGSGAVGSIHLDYIRRTYDCSLEVVGDEGTIQWCYQDHSVKWYVAREGRWHSMRWPNYDDNEMYLAEMLHFLRVLEDKEMPQLDVAGGSRILAVALAVKEAAKSQRVLTI